MVKAIVHMRHGEVARYDSHLGLRAVMTFALQQSALHPLNRADRKRIVA